MISTKNACKLQKVLKFKGCDKNLRFWFKKFTYFQMVMIFPLLIIGSDLAIAQIDKAQAKKLVDGLAECAAIYTISIEHIRDETSGMQLVARAKQFMDTAYFIAQQGNLPDNLHASILDHYLAEYRPEWPLSILRAYQFNGQSSDVVDFMRKITTEKCSNYNEIVNLVTAPAG